MVNLFRPIKTTSEKLVSIQRKAGQLIFVTDKKRLYIDISSAENGRLLVSADSFIDVSCDDGKTLTFVKADGTSASASIAVDDKLLADSTNAVQNKVIHAKVAEVLNLISANTGAIEAVNGRVDSTNTALSTLETSKVDVAIADIRTLNGQFVDLTAKDTELALEDARLAGLIGANANAIDALEGRVGTNETSIENLGKKDTELNAAISANTKSIEGHTSDISDLQGRASTIETNITNLKAEDTGIKTRVSNIETTLSGVSNVKTYVDNAKKAAIDAAAADAKNKDDALRVEIEAYADDKVGALNTSLDTRISPLESDRDDHRARIEAMETFFSVADNKDELVNTIQELNAYINQHGEAAASMANSINENADNIAELVKNLSQAISNSDNADEALGNRIDVLQEDVNTRAKQSDLDGAKTDIVELEGDLDTLAGRVTDVEGIASTNATNIGTLRTDLGTLQGSVSGNAQAISAIQQDYLKKADKTALENAIDEVEKKAFSSVSANGTTLTFTTISGENKTVETKDTTYSEASTTSAGLMSAADKKKLNSLGESKKIIFISAQGYADLGSNIESNAIYFIN